MARRRRCRHDHEPENLERWLVSYADFITLLFAFFVVMYSISSVNEGKYRVLSDSLAAVFTTPKLASHMADPIQIGDPGKGDNLIGSPSAGYSAASDQIIPDPLAEPQNAPAQLEAVADEVSAVLSPYIQDDLVVVRKHKQWVEVEMKSGMLFPSGSAKLAEDALPMLYRMSEIFRDLPNAIQVEGHTDNVPISNIEFANNWALSSARAAVVVDRLAKDGVDPRKLSAIGYGEFHPVADNGSDPGRFQNRRVAIVLLAPGATRYPVNPTAKDSPATAAPDVTPSPQP